MPSAAAIDLSSGVVMKPRTRSALAPTYAVRTVTVALSSFGYWRTLSDRIAWKPAMRITRLTTIARAGRLMKMSVNFTRVSAILEFRVQLGRRTDRVVDDHARAVSQFEGPGSHDFFPRPYATDDCDEIATRCAELYELLARHLERAPVPARGFVAFRILDDEH